MRKPFDEQVVPMGSYRAPDGTVTNIPFINADQFVAAARAADIADAVKKTDDDRIWDTFGVLICCLAAALSVSVILLVVIDWWLGSVVCSPEFPPLFDCG